LEKGTVEFRGGGTRGGRHIQRKDLGLVNFAEENGTSKRSWWPLRGGGPGEKILVPRKSHSLLIRNWKGSEGNRGVGTKGKRKSAGNSFGKKLSPDYRRSYTKRGAGKKA